MVKIIFFACALYALAIDLSNSFIIPGSEGSQVGECTITFYKSVDFDGQSLEHQQDSDNVDIQEHSIETFGNCCWSIYT